MKKTLLLALFGAVASLSAQEWTRYRGPNGSGLGKAELPAEFNKDSFLWSIEVPGEGYSSPVLWGDRLFITSSNEAGTSRSLLCYSAKDGSLIWESKHKITPHHVNDKFTNHASTTAAVDAERVYFIGGNGNQIDLRALDHDGKPVWDRSWKGNGVRGTSTDHGMHAAPILSDGVLIVPLDRIGKGARISGLNPATGKDIWDVERSNAKDSYSSPVIHKTAAGDSQAIFVSTSGGFTAIDPKSGKYIWEYNPGYRQRSVGGPVLANGLVFSTLGSGGGAKESAALQPGTLDRKPKLAYSITKGLPYVPSPIVVDDVMYLLNDGGLLSGIDHKSGEVLFDRERLSEGASVKWFASPVSDGRHLYCSSQGGEMVILKTGRDYKVVGRHDFGELINACPAIANGNLYIRTATKLHAIKGG